MVPLTRVIFTRSRTIWTFSTTAALLRSIAGAASVSHTPAPPVCAHNPDALTAASSVNINVFLMGMPPLFAKERKRLRPSIQVHGSHLVTGSYVDTPQVNPANSMDLR